MKKHTGFIALLFLFYPAVQAQIILKGNVHSSTDEALSFINVAVFSETDTTRLITGSITDIRGNYVMSPIRAGKYRMVISGIGYHTLRETIRLRMPSAGNVVTKDFTTDEEATSLDEVVIKATRKSTYVDKSVYTFSKEQIKDARYSNDLLTGVGELSVDVMTNKIGKMGGGSVKILINGVNATDNDLKSIPPEKVIKVEYYDIPPARYSTVSTLVNVITKRLDTGWNGGIDASHAFSTGFGNDNLYLKYIAGNHQVSLDYTLQYRDYNNRIATNTYQYQLNEKNIDYTYQSKEKFGYADNTFNLKYTYNRPDDYTLQAILSPNFSTRFSNGNSNVFLLTDENPQNGLKFYDNNTRTFGPAANLYFSKKMKRSQELTFELVGTYYYNKQENLNQETDTESGEIILEDNMNQRNDKKSLIAEVAYTKAWGLRLLSIGYKGILASSTSTISNYLSEGEKYDYRSRNNNHYFYAEYGNTYKNLMYRIGVGATWVDTHNDDAKFSKILFTPKLILGYKLKSGQNLQWALSSSPSIPSISQMSNNAELITSGLLRCGNPYLRSGNNYTATFRYNLNRSWLDFNLIALVSYDQDPINTYYMEKNINGKNYIVSTSENAKSFLQYGGGYSLSIRPFNNEVLLLKLYGLVVNQELKSPIIGKFSHWYVPLFYSLNFRKGNWGATYSGNIVSKQLDGAYMSQDENQSNLQIFYQHKNLRLIAGCYWLFSKSKYHNETLPNDLLRHNSRSYINDNRSMFTLGFSWNFSTGKTFNVKRKMQNKDTDKGTF
ncbi:carboxypeptidase-like regulatory domain-containing protein [Bacteroides fluxus]|jgi:hypothetical protein|uniref:carboxypeptidase-like regulatory domain-containing protein n=1 Tax=Bacteroides fluxus TaxID=626930 RepID=UPI002A83F663|nr:outer membrane beta-barrel protein [Bacteroides fluxus]MDY3789916.1 outer membrane beta-barrel protein [Bacteroides fluxus]